MPDGTAAAVAQVAEGAAAALKEHQMNIVGHYRRL